MNTRVNVIAKINAFCVSTILRTCLGIRTGAKNVPQILKYLALDQISSDKPSNFDL